MTKNDMDTLAGTLRSLAPLLNEYDIIQIVYYVYGKVDKRKMELEKLQL